MKIRHLAVILHAKRVILVSPYTEPQLIDCDHAIACGPLKHVQLYETLLAGMNYFEFGETHLEHHVRLL